MEREEQSDRDQFLDLQEASVKRLDKDLIKE